MSESSHPSVKEMRLQFYLCEAGREAGKSEACPRMSGASDRTVEDGGQNVVCFIYPILKEKQVTVTSCQSNIEIIYHSTCASRALFGGQATREVTVNECIWVGYLRHVTVLQRAPSELRR